MSVSLPLDFADQILDLQMRLEDQESLQLLQILCQMYRIGVDYYIDHDFKRAQCMQRKLNALMVKSLSASSVDNPQKSHKNKLKLRQEISDFSIKSQTYVKNIVDTNEKNHQRKKKIVEDELNRQEESLHRRLLKRVRSSERL